jgi:hypothetical protein
VLIVENRGRQKDRGKGSGKHGNSRKGKSKSRLGKIECWNCGKKVFALFSSLCEQKVSAYMPSWALLGMTAVM